MSRRLVDYDARRSRETILFRSLYVSEDEKYVAVVQLLLYEAEVIYVGVNVSFHEAVIEDGLIDLGKRLGMRSFFVPMVKKTDPEAVEKLVKTIFEIIENILESRLRGTRPSFTLPKDDDDLPIFVRVFYDFVLTRSFTKVHRS